VARGAADWALRFQEPCGVVSNRYWGLRREFTSPIANLWAVYQATWEERYGDCARRTLSWFVKTQKPNGAFATDVATDGPRGDQPRVSDPTDPGGGGMEGYSLTEGFRLTQDPAIKESIIACANWFVDSVERGCDLGRDVPSGPAPLKNWKSPLWHMSIPTVVLAEAYRLTGDERYVRPMRDLIEDFPVAGRDWAAMVGRTCWQYAGLAPQVLAAALAAVAESDRRARQG
jgi:hypothetical protein